MPHQLRSHPRKNCKEARACRVTNRHDGLIRKYDLLLCRQAFREQANTIGFFKYRWTAKLVLRRVENRNTFQTCLFAGSSLQGLPTPCKMSVSAHKTDEQSSLHGWPRVVVARGCGTSHLHSTPEDLQRKKRLSAFEQKLRTLGEHDDNAIELHSYMWWRTANRNALFEKLFASCATKIWEWKLDV